MIAAPKATATWHAKEPRMSVEIEDLEGGVKAYEDGYCVTEQGDLYVVVDQFGNIIGTHSSSSVKGMRSKGPRPEQF